jgi:hypothetical protein
MASIEHNEPVFDADAILALVTHRKNNKTPASKRNPRQATRNAKTTSSNDNQDNSGPTSSKAVLKPPNSSSAWSSKSPNPAKSAPNAGNPTSRSRSRAEQPINKSASLSHKNKPATEAPAAANRSKSHSRSTSTSKSPAEEPQTDRRSRSRSISSLSTISAASNSGFSLPSFTPRSISTSSAYSVTYVKVKSRRKSSAFGSSSRFEQFSHLNTTPLAAPGPIYSSFTDPSKLGISMRPRLTNVVEAEMARAAEIPSVGEYNIGNIDHRSQLTFDLNSGVTIAQKTLTLEDIERNEKSLQPSAAEYNVDEAFNTLNCAQGVPIGQRLRNDVDYAQDRSRNVPHSYGDIDYEASSSSHSMGGKSHDFDKFLAEKAQLPSSADYNNVAFSASTPAVSIGGKLKNDVDYAQDRSRNIPHAYSQIDYEAHSQSYSMGQKSQEFEQYLARQANLPSAADYNANDSYQQLNAGESRSLGAKLASDVEMKQRNSANSPAPNQYQSIDYKPNSQAYSIGHKSNQFEQYLAQQAQLPSAAEYKPADSFQQLNCAPSAILGSRLKSDVDYAQDRSRHVPHAYSAIEYLPNTAGPTIGQKSQEFERYLARQKELPGAADYNANESFQQLTAGESRSMGTKLPTEVDIKQKLTASTPGPATYLTLLKNRAPSHSIGLPVPESASNSGPSPQDYALEAAEQHKQLNSPQNRGYIGEKLTTVIEKEIKRAANIPGMGEYSPNLAAVEPNLRSHSISQRRTVKTDIRPAAGDYNAQEAFNTLNCAQGVPIGQRLRNDVDYAQDRSRNVPHSYGDIDYEASSSSHSMGGKSHDFDKFLAEKAQLPSSADYNNVAFSASTPAVSIGGKLKNDVDYAQDRSRNIPHAYSQIDYEAHSQSYSMGQKSQEFEQYLARQANLPSAADYNANDSYQQLNAGESRSLGAKLASDVEMKQRNSANSPAPNQYQSIDYKPNSQAYSIGHKSNQFEQYLAQQAQLPSAAEYKPADSFQQLNAGRAHSIGGKLLSDIDIKQRIAASSPGANEYQSVEYKTSSPAVSIAHKSMADHYAAHIAGSEPSPAEYRAQESYNKVYDRDSLHRSILTRTHNDFDRSLAESGTASTAPGAYFMEKLPSAFDKAQKPGEVVVIKTVKKLSNINNVSNASSGVSAENSRTLALVKNQEAKKAFLARAALAQAKKEAATGTNNHRSSNINIII